MRFALTDEQDQLSQAVARVVAADAAPAELWQALTDMGVVSLGLDAGRGGSGGGVLDLALVAEQTGAGLAAAPFASGPVMAGMLLRQLSGSDADMLIAEMTRGLTVVAVPGSLPWPGRRDPLDGLTLERELLSGELPAVPAVPAGSAVLVLVGDREATTVLAFRSGQPGTYATDVAALDPSEPLTSVRFDNAAVTVLAEGQEAVAAAVGAVAAASAVMAVELAGTGMAVFAQAVAYAKTREQFGRPIGSFQGLKHMLADRYVELDAARASALYACALLDDGNPGSAIAARAALASATDAAHHAAGDALQVFGGIGFTWEHPAHRYLRRTRARRSLLGTPAQQLDALADELDRAEVPA